MKQSTIIRGFCIAAVLLSGTVIAQEHTERTTRFKQIDKNNDGKLSLLEFQTRPSNARPEDNNKPIDAKTMAERGERFKQLDLDHDGFLNFAEFEATLTTPQPKAAK